MAELPGSMGDPESDHPDVDELIGYVRGELTQHAAASVRAHASTCIDCGDQLAALILLRESREAAAGASEAPVATVTRFPVPANRPAPRRRVAVAFAASLLVATAGFVWWAQIGGPEHTTGTEASSPPAAMELPFQTVEFERTEEDVRLTMETAEFLTMIHNPGMYSAADGTRTDEMLVALGIKAVVDRDLPEALRVLEPFRSRWGGDGTAIVGSVLFLQGDPAAYQVLEMYAADHPKQVREADEDGVEALAFFLLAKLRHALGQNEGAIEALAWIAPGGDTGRTAGRWREATFGHRSELSGEPAVER